MNINKCLSGLDNLTTPQHEYVCLELCSVKIVNAESCIYSSSAGPLKMQPVPILTIPLFEWLMGPQN